MLFIYELSIAVSFHNSRVCMCVCGEKSQYIDVLVVVLLEQFSHFSDMKEQYTFIYKLVFEVRDYFMLLVFKEGGQD